MVVGCYYDAKKDNKNDLIQIYSYFDSKKEYVLIGTLSEDGHTDSITDVEWAPQFGRSYHLIASCSLDKKLIIWKIELKFDLNNEHFDNIIILKKEKLFEHKHESEAIIN